MSARDWRRAEASRARFRCVAFARFGGRHVGSAVAIYSRGARPEGAAAAATAEAASAEAMSARRRSLRNGLRGSPCLWESVDSSRRWFRRFRRCLHLRALTANDLRSEPPRRQPLSIGVSGAPSRFTRAALVQREPPQRRPLKQRVPADEVCGTGCVGVHARRSPLTPRAGGSADSGVASICGHSRQTSSRASRRSGDRENLEPSRLCSFWQDAARVNRAAS